LDSLTANKDEWEKRYKKIIPVIKKQIILVEEIIASFMENNDVSRISDFNLLCFGYLIIANNNLKATYLLVIRNLYHQAHFIRRSMFEMALNLFYMDHNIDYTRDALVGRYFDHGKVRSYETLQTMLRHPEGFENVRNEVKDKTVMTEYHNYLTKYELVRKPQSWSGKPLDKMIASISDDKLQTLFLEEYELLNRVDNWLLHPSAFYVKMAIEDEVFNNECYAAKAALLSSMYQLTHRIISKFFYVNEACATHFEDKLKELLDMWKPDGEVQDKL
jgi:hypothetical protein